MRRLGAALAGGLAVLVVAIVAARSQTAPGPLRVEAHSIPLDATDPRREREGELAYAGGLVLRAPGVKGFGGLSGLIVQPDGRFLSQSDAGDLVSGRLVLDGRGRLAGVAEAAIARLTDEQGKPFAPRKVKADAEDITRLPDGGFAVSFEGRPRVLAYDGRGGVARRLAIPPEARTLRSNKGLEALAAFADAAGRPRLVEGAEDGRAWSCDLGGRGCEQILDQPPDEAFRLTGLDALPGGLGLVGVYRAVDLIHGARALVAWIRPGAAEPISVLAKLQWPDAVDNMEGIAAVANPDGSVRLYLVSDDNFSFLQRTLLLAFDWRPPAAPPSRSASPEREVR